MAEDLRNLAMTGLHGATLRLRNIASIGLLLRRAATETGNLGFTRAVVSRVDGDCWRPVSCWVDGAEVLDCPVDEVALEHETPEMSIVRGRQAALVLDTQRFSSSATKLMKILNCTSYVAAPVVVGESVVGLLHADCGSGRQVDNFDMQVLELFAGFVGTVVERLVLAARLQAIRREATLARTSMLDVANDMLDLASPLGDGDSGDAVLRPGRPPSPHPTLTTREREVLGLMATGETNGQIASRLVVSESTVKAHVKHILRKLNAANRAEAVARYFSG